MLDSQLKKIKNVKADITFRGDFEWNFLISDVFWFNLAGPSFIYKKKNKIITFVSSRISLTISHFDIVNYF